MRCGDRAAKPEASRDSLGPVLLEGTSRGHEAIARCLRDGRPREDRRLAILAGTGREARAVHRAAVLRCMCLEGLGLREALDARRDGAHPLGGARTRAAAVVPGVSVGRAELDLALGGSGEEREREEGGSNAHGFSSDVQDSWATPGLSL